MAMPSVVAELVDRFAANRNAYRSADYNEARLRQEFLNPFFEALGWDVTNRQGYAEAYKDVIHEDAIKIGGVSKAPDYCFRVGGTRKYFVEAKKPAVNVKEDPAAAFQLRRYAWSAGLPLGIVTDFEEFAVYDCRMKPSVSDKASAARTLYCGCTEYDQRWDAIAAIFARESILKGSFDKYAEAKKAGTAEVDAAFLADIERWREEIAQNLALRNPGLSQRELNYAVQTTIDRLIFLRICEDRGIEPGGQLLGAIGGAGIYPRLCKIFHKADERYNSGLFHFERERGRAGEPDDLTLRLNIDDRVLKDIIRSVYPPHSPYEFSVLPADILGQVYERFLGKVIRLTAGHRAVVEEKPEVKKAGGVYYTPTYIVQYIVKETVGKLLEGKSIRQAAAICIADPACGSGSFLIVAYQYLLDWHRDRYIEAGTQKHKKEVYEGAGGVWRLTAQERKRILLNNIFGVDIDTQAVEVTKLSLLLKVLEGESEQTLSQQLSLFHQRALPDLDSNIKCGNSLIGPEFYRKKELSLFDDEEQYRINVFDWKTEFPQVFKGESGGFDVIMGNPPYIRVRTFREIHPEQVSYLQEQYRCASHVWDIYMLFFERALAILRIGGRFSFIVPIQTLHQPNCESLRKMLLSETSLEAIVDLSKIKVFQSAIVKNCILVCTRGRDPLHLITTSAPSRPIDLGSDEGQARWPQDSAANNPGFSLKLDLLSPTIELCAKLRAKSWELSELCYVTFGLRSCAKGKGAGGKERLIVTDPGAENAKPYLEGRNVVRYGVDPQAVYIRYLPDEMYSPRSPALFETKKIISQTMLSKMRVVATLDEDSFYVEQSLACIVPHGVVTPLSDATPQFPLEFILGIINSQLQCYYFGSWIIDHSLGGGLIHATPGSQGRLIVPKVTLNQTVAMVQQVRTRLNLHKRMTAAHTPSELATVKRQIDITDHQIDHLVYELYGLTDEEIAIVENDSQAALSSSQS